MRPGELLAQAWQTTDLEGGSVRIERQLIPTRGGATFGSPKSKRSNRTIALDAETVEALRHHRETQLLERDLAGAAYEDHDLVFCDELGRRIYPKRLTEWFLRHRKAAGVPTGSLHVLRHTMATLALTASPPVPLHIVAGRLGDRPETLLRVYAHNLPQSDSMAAEAVAAVLVDKRLTSAVESNPQPPS
jgi:integrase